MSPYYQLEVIGLQLSEAMRVQRQKLYWTITSLSTSDIVSLKDINALVQPNVFGSTFGSSAKVAHGNDRVVSALSKVLKTTVE